MTERIAEKREHDIDRQPEKQASPVAGGAPAARPDAPAPTHLFRHLGGYAAQGTGFYVWDEDPAEVIRVAEALVAGRFDGSNSARYMVIETPGLLGA